ncbi:MAG: methylated-DNA--[protein]-cysteine S-methyltransferase [Myxococcales bacterium]|nr:methylated-DNA--[protein]-cysteine S-methyltransferase [Myxococcales bacterium]
MIRTAHIDSPIGPLRADLRGDTIAALHLPGRAPEHADACAAADDDPLLVELRQQLAQYFAGKRTRFDLPLAPQGTDFQRNVWRALEAIEHGSTRSYQDIARQVGSAPRAIGHANARNPIAIIVPCHRVIGADGTLTGYAGGLPTKRWLLQHEGALLT